MKVWKYELTLTKESHNKINFNIKEYNGNLTFNKNKDCWIYCKPKEFEEHIPNYLKVNNYENGVAIGLNKKLNKEETCKLKEDMRKLLLEILMKRKEEKINEYNSKINCLKSMNIIRELGYEEKEIK